MKKGKAILKEEEKLAAQKKQKAEQRKKTGGLDPNRTRFRLAAGESAEVVILDASVNTVAFYEHHMKKDGKWGNFESCPGEWSNCPLCSGGDNSSFVWFLTILDTRGYVKDDGTEVPYYRRLLCVKQTQAPAFKRILKAAQKANGTTRGTVLVLERDTGDKSAAIGEPVIAESGHMFEFLDEDEMVDEFGHAAIVARNDDVLVEKNGLLLAFDYESLFSKPDAKDIAKRWGLESGAGSDDEYEEAEEEEDYEEEEEDGEEDGEEPPKRRATKKADTKPKSPSSTEEEDDEDDDDIPF